MEEDKEDLKTVLLKGDVVMREMESGRESVREREREREEKREMRK